MPLQILSWAGLAWAFDLEGLGEEHTVKDAQHWLPITISELYSGTEVLRRKEKKTVPRKEAAHGSPCHHKEFKAAVRGDASTSLFLGPDDSWPSVIL